MGIPTAVGPSLQVLRALRGGDAQKALALATNAGKKRIKRILASPTDPCAEAIRAWEGSVQTRTQGTRAMSRFSAFPDAHVAILDLRLEPGGWHLEDVLSVESSVYEAFGSPDPTAP